MEQVGVSSSVPGAATQVDIQVSNSSGSLVLHWGIICEREGYVQCYILSYFDIPQVLLVFELINNSL